MRIIQYKREKLAFAILSIVFSTADVCALAIHNANLIYI